MTIILFILYSLTCSSWRTAPIRTPRILNFGEAGQVAVGNTHVVSQVKCGINLVLVICVYVISKLLFLSGGFL